MSTTDGKGDLYKQANFRDRAACNHDAVYPLNIRNSNKNNYTHAHVQSTIAQHVSRLDPIHEYLVEMVNCIFKAQVTCLHRYTQQLEEALLS